MFRDGLSIFLGEAVIIIVGFFSILVDFALSLLVSGVANPLLLYLNVPDSLGDGGYFFVQHLIILVFVCGIILYSYGYKKDGIPFSQQPLILVFGAVFFGSGVFPVRMQLNWLDTHMGYFGHEPFMSWIHLNFALIVLRSILLIVAGLIFLVTYALTVRKNKTKELHEPPN